jgi:hypothetical protein
MAVPPPRRFDLRDGGTVVGWVEGTRFGFRGFGNADEAAHAAWVAYRTMQRRLARAAGRRLIPIDIEPMSLVRRDDAELILAGGRPIATLVRPGADSPSGPVSFGFELELPEPADRLSVRSTAYLAYRTLRRSGIRWTMWLPERPAPSASREIAASAREAAAAPRDDERHDAADAGTREQAGVRSGVIAAALIALVALAALALPAVTISTLTYVLGGAAAIVALIAAASLIHVVVADSRDALLGRARSDGNAARTGRRATYAGRLAELRAGLRGRPVPSAADGAAGSAT